MNLSKVMTALRLSTLISSALALSMLGLSQVAQAQEQGTGKVHVSIFNDADQDGVMDESEKPADSETVQLFRIDENGDRTLVQTAKTDENGQFVFENLPYGRYVVVYEQSTGVTIETLPFGVSEDHPDVFIKPAPLLPKGPRLRFSLLSLGFRNPANVVGDQVSRFAP